MIDVPTCVDCINSHIPTCQDKDFDHCIDEPTDYYTKDETELLTPHCQHNYIGLRSSRRTLTNNKYNYSQLHKLCTLCHKSLGYYVTYFHVYNIFYGCKECMKEAIGIEDPSSVYLCEECTSTELVFYHSHHQKTGLCNFKKRNISDKNARETKLE